ncbi:hypothetical protein G6F46_009037 [Rhizopus delemar]|uniref:Uncharacterized protein n=2 Tax=Rhizopus delemar TaxID=936053 RepID=I1CPP1_RHIO9|nr:hypothetical protein RO3G_15132 [Rhizopus delemar RA 99-880]KAG1446409.1 hypothetical protein G6F55_011552 [Rhizopus delemar]KAG1618949.1 hypothetical protein G6F45_011828 [Rhizopus arrhizus]KAG1534477.1 hypothetical protein G6F49_013353 [Rhizopus delemar]KAG1563588.1 hypothetical protein G6F50_011859 [Rhizopus delemar]|eukprot:EIE90421.1 hypothetical protein RO3G_15132 [Rhizopus delemar RA 99-880]
MVLSNLETFPPAKPPSRLPNNAITPVKKDWSAIVKGSIKTSSYDRSSSTTITSTSNIDAVDAVTSHYRLSSMRPFLKGASEGSVLLEITNVKDKKLFLTELKELCDDNTHLWSIEDVIRQDFGRLFAGITFSPEYAELACNTGLKLPSFDSPFQGYRSLPPDSEVLTITFIGLPRQYGPQSAIYDKQPT